MQAALITYWPLVLVCVIGVALIVTLVLYARKSEPVREIRFKWHYLFLWPLLFDWLQKDPKRAGVLFTKRELIGWGLVLLLVVVAIIINPARSI